MKKYLSLLSALLIVLITLQPVKATSELITLHSEYAYLFDPISNIEYINKNADEKMYPASMTKILTVSVSLEKIENLDDKVVVLKKDFDDLLGTGATVAQLNPGEKVTYRDLLYGALLPSGADACNVLARTLFGSYQGMVDAMNEHIKKLNLTQTHFVNVTGLHDENHYTTAKEMAYLLKDALKNKDFVTIFNARSYQDSLKKRTWYSILSRAQTQKNLDVSSIDGAKSGYTDEAQLTLASTMTIDNQQLIFVTAKANDKKTQNNVLDALNVYQYMSQNYHRVIIYKKDETIQHYWILKSLNGIYSLKSMEEFSLLVDKDINKDNIDTKYNGDVILSSPLKQGETLGSVKITHKDTLLCEYQVSMDKSMNTDTIAIILHYVLLILIPLVIILKIIKKIKSKH
ncbi:MAG: serine hydrolase [Coprobacillus sp.]